MNKAFAELAYRPGPKDDEDPVEFWLGRIRRLRNSRVEVPDDEAVREGIRTQPDGAQRADKEGASRWE